MSADPKYRRGDEVLVSSPDGDWQGIVVGRARKSPSSGYWYSVQKDNGFTWNVNESALELVPE